MCFSATAGFAASAILAVAGTAAQKKEETPSHLVFSGIPFIFSIQQFREGFVWLSLTHPGDTHWQTAPIHIFLGLAQVV